MGKPRVISLVSKKTVIVPANAFKITPGTKYLIQVANITEEDVTQLWNELKKWGITAVVVVRTDSMKVVEVKQ